ncbi:hypothetical protein Tco_0251211 [Tanacetum coccineum]
MLALPPSFQASTSGVNEPRHYTRRNASASTSRTSTSTTLYDESEEDSVDEDDIENSLRIVINNQTCGKEKGKSSGKDLEGQSSAVGNDGSYEESQDPNFDPFADLDLILPTMGNMEGNSGHVVETEGEENEQAIETESEEDTEANDETDSEDSDYLVDEENNVDDVDVDMKDFDFHVDEGVEFMGCRDSEQTVDIEEGDGEEIEVLDNDYFESASDSDDEGSRLRKRKLKEIRKQAHANEQIYKTYFYVGKRLSQTGDAMTYLRRFYETRRGK